MHLKHEWDDLFDSMKINWVICNSFHGTLSHSLIWGINAPTCHQTSSLNFVPHVTDTRTIMCPYLYRSVSQLRVEEQTNVNRRAVASIRAVRVDRWKVMREEKQAGEPPEFWWVLSRRELGGKTGAGTWALHAEMRWFAALCSCSFVHSAASVGEICG